MLRGLAKTILAAVAALGLTAGMSPAGAATSWRLAYAGARTSGYDWFDATVATGPSDAWAFGGSLTTEAQWAPVARHWNGRSWTAAALPAGLERGISVAGATGPNNVWAFAGGDEGGDAYALRWNGHRWAVAHRWPGSDILSGAAVVNAHDVWVFGSSRIGPGIGTWHYDGHAWTQVETPVGQLASASVVAPDDIWAVGTLPPGDNDDLLARWDGHAWNRVEVPGLPQGENHFTSFTSVYAASSRDVWIVGHDDQFGDDADTVTPLAFHFDGRSWQRLDPPKVGNGILNRVAPDGRGGVWVIPSVDEPYDTPELLHYSGGQWTAVRPARPDGKVLRVHDLTTVPRSRTAWAAGEVFPPDRDTSDGAIWVNG